jgi:hypothetical protein
MDDADEARPVLSRQSGGANLRNRSRLGEHVRAAKNGDRKSARSGTRRRTRDSLGIITIFAPGQSSSRRDR